MGDTRGFDRSHFYSPEKQAIAYHSRRWMLRYMGDFDAKKKRLREGKVLDAPWSGIRPEGERKCSVCKQPTIFTTPKGRSVHPTCEGWVDDLTPQAEVAVLFAVAKAFGVNSVEVVDE